MFYKAGWNLDEANDTLNGFKTAAETKKFTTSQQDWALKRLIHFIIHFNPRCVPSDPLQLSVRASRICSRMFLALMKEVRSLMLYTTTNPSAQSTGSSSMHLASELCQEQHMLLFWNHTGQI